MRVIAAFWMALSMFTAIPIPAKVWRDDAADWMLAWFPAVGAVLGLLWSLIAWACLRFGLPAPLSAAVIAAAPLLLTGFFHLDGFLDTCDAVLSRRDREERLRILKDSHVGAFAVISLGLLLMLQFAAALTLAQGGPSAALLLLAIPAATRAPAALMMTTAKPLPHSQYSGRSAPKRRVFLLCALLFCALLLGLLCGGMRGLLVACAAAALYLLFLAYAAYDLGGVSGDLSGFALTAAECGALIAAALLI